MARAMVDHFKTGADTQIRQFNQVQYSRALQQAIQRAWYRTPVRTEAVIGHAGKQMSSSVRSISLAIALLGGYGIADSTTVKYTARASLEFAQAGDAISKDHEARLAELVRATLPRCSLEYPDLVVTVEAAVESAATKDENANALAQTKNVRETLRTLGVPVTSIYAGSATLESLTARVTAGSNIDVSPNVVVVEFVCNPRSNT